VLKLKYIKKCLES
jgi:hypothetical protein